jgi:hypothetical protein
VSFETEVISEGTLRPQDVIPAMMGLLERLNPDRLARIKEEFHAFDFEESLENQDHLEGEEMDHLWEALDTAINEELPDGFFFGASDGDGACFGVWSQSVTEDKHEPEPKKKHWVLRRYVSESCGYGKYGVYEYLSGTCVRAVVTMLPKREADRTSSRMNEAVHKFAADNDIELWEI